MIGIDEMKAIELEILIKFAKACEENNLRYFLGAGTLLGAIRHKGFIPWDDDVDVYMPRPDYMRFLELAPSFAAEGLDLLDSYRHKDYFLPFAKLTDSRTVLRHTKSVCREMGVYIDIFPIDGLPADIRKSNRHFFYIGILHILRAQSQVRYLRARTLLRTLIKVPIVLFAKAVGPRFWLNRIEKCIRKYDFETSEYVAMQATGVYGNRERIDKQSFTSYVDVVFEGHVFKAPAGYEKYLTSCYGDYMQPPPEDKRVSRHFLEAYWK